MDQLHSPRVLEGCVVIHVFECRTLLFVTGFTDPENMGVAEEDDFDGCVGYR